MGLSRRGNRPESPIWPGFVDAMTSLLMVLMFVLTVFVLVQSVLRETITTQGDELESLTAQVASLADALGLEKKRAEGLQTEVGRLGSELTAAEAEGRGAIGPDRHAARPALGAGRANWRRRRPGSPALKAQVASLLSERDAARGQAGALTAEVDKLKTEQARLMTQEEPTEPRPCQGAGRDRCGHGGRAAGSGTDRCAEPYDRGDEGQGGGA